MKIEIPNEALVILIGVSGSGKSTWASKHFVAESIVSSDRCRELVLLNRGIDPQKLPVESYWREMQTVSREAFDLMHNKLKALLGQNKIAVADATHLTARYRRSLEEMSQQYGIPIVYVVFNLCPATCEYRDSQRSHPVGAEVIKSQIQKFKSGWTQLSVKNPVVINENELDTVEIQFVPTIHSMKPMEERVELQSTSVVEGPHDTIVCDLDGTLANIDHRLKYVKDKRNSNWDLFFKECVNDVPNEWCVELLRSMLVSGKKVLIVSARSKVVEKETKEWVDKAIFGKDWTGLGAYMRYHDKLNVVLVRDGGDYTPDQVLKKRWLDGFGKGNILFVIDDRDKVCKMWVENGLQVLNCGQGKIF
jgi:predicted kinase